MVRAIGDSGTMEYVTQEEVVEVRAISGLKSSSGGDGWLFTPPVARQLGFGHNPFKKYPKKEDPRVVTLVAMNPSEGGDGYWDITVCRADGVTQDLVLSCARDATDKLFDELSYADKAALRAPWETAHAC
ncbi:hypothetical protein CA260_12570 [Dyella jiangningensis]|uniref:Uncharacterized protein n=2 Tax=Dyella jiangningensis TaxID=1379159 RepID=A0A328P0L6_9GAMM|nr:hypothetical protein CA260_12570 [Dyella jiangningensis]